MLEKQRKLEAANDIFAKLTELFNIEFFKIREYAINN
jgi:hypothetical protein